MRGAGFLALSSKAQVAPLQLAGGQEGGLRGGTENVAGAIGLLVAAEHALTHQVTTATHTRHLADLVHAELRDALGDVERLGHPDRALPHILSMRLPGIVGHTLLERCSDRGVAFSTGSACHGHPAGGGDDRKAADNHVLAAIGFDRLAAREVIRLSFCRDTTEAEAETGARILADEALRLRAAAPPAFGSMEGQADQADGAERR